MLQTAAVIALTHHERWDGRGYPEGKAGAPGYGYAGLTSDLRPLNAYLGAKEVGVVPIGPGGGATLRFLAAVTEARAAVEVGTGTGASGLWMLRGMRPDGVLTTVDTEAEHQRLAVEIALLKAATFPRLRSVEEALAGGAAPSGATRVSRGESKPHAQRE